MAQCLPTESPYSTSLSNGATPQEACTLFGANNAFAIFESMGGVPFVCKYQDIEDPENPTVFEVEITQNCEPAPQPMCTASAPCVVNWSTAQTHQFESWTFVFLVVAMVFAVLHGLTYGSSRV